VVLNTDNSDPVNRAAPSLGPTTILVVDDDPDVLWSTSKILRDAGFVILEGAGAVDAIKLTLEHCPALVLLDVNLPDGNGVDVALQIKKDPLLSSVFVVLCSGERISKRDQVDGLNRGLADGYIIRPVGKDELIARIDAFLRIRAALEALRQANKKLTLLSSITRHDINNQLTVLMGFLTILKKKQTDPTLNDYFVKVSNAAQRISSMIQFTSEYEKIGVNTPVWQEIRPLADTAAKQLTFKKVEVKNVLPDGAEVFADPLFVKVFYNLMDNAVRYGGKITTIQFSVEEAGDCHLIVCEDDGDGVVAEEKEKIFERGFGKNTGLGLALAREILDITGITIRETGEPGKGARFEMVVPKGSYRNYQGTSNNKEDKT
jgi:signal transduction histidine kinase